jgi:hypothetical protein
VKSREVLPGQPEIAYDRTEKGRAARPARLPGLHACVAQRAMDDALVDVQTSSCPLLHVLGSEPSQLFDEVLTLTHWISLKVKAISSRVAAWDIWSCS